MEAQVGQHWGIRDTGKIDGQPALGSGLHIAAVRAMYAVARMERTLNAGLRGLDFIHRYQGVMEDAWRG